MARAVHLGAWFLLGCIASSFISWLGALHPALFRVMWVIYSDRDLIIILASVWEKFAIAKRQPGAR